MITIIVLTKVAISSSLDEAYDSLIRERVEITHAEIVDTKERIRLLDISVIRLGEKLDRLANATDKYEGHDNWPTTQPMIDGQ